MLVMARQKNQNRKNANFAKKSLGQNFLNNTQIRDSIVDEAGDLTDKAVLEIGPGLGFLTCALLKAKADLTAIELDERVIWFLKKEFGHMDHFQLIPGNFLEISLDEIFKEKAYSIIANIPYNITNPIIKKILSQTKNKPDFCIFMVQKEVAQKICNTQKRSILSISVEVFADAKYCFTVGKENFDPSPKVESAILRLNIKEKPMITAEDEMDFFTVVNAGFSQKRKKIGNHIGKFFGLEPNKLLGDIDPSRRAETLEIEDWITITKNFQKEKESLNQ